jgi:hypothetical protein
MAAVSPTSYRPSPREWDEGDGLSLQPHQTGKQHRLYELRPAREERVPERLARGFQSAHQHQQMRADQLATTGEF